MNFKKVCLNSVFIGFILEFLISETVSWPGSNDEIESSAAITGCTSTLTPTEVTTTEAQTTTKRPKPSYNISGWKWIEKSRNPTGFDDFFFTTSEINLRFQPPEQLQASILVSNVETFKVQFLYVSFFRLLIYINFLYKM